MQPAFQTLEYAEGETFLPHRGILAVLFISFALPLAGVVAFNIQLLHVPSLPRPLHLLLLIEAVQLLLIIEVTYFTVCLVRSFIRLHKQGIEYRPSIFARPTHWRTVHVHWHDVRAATLVRRGNRLSSIRLELHDRPKPARILLGLYSNHTHLRIEAILRHHIPLQNLHERRRPLWSLRP